MHNTVLLKMCFLKNVLLENAYIYNVSINIAKTRSDLESYQITLWMLFKFYAFGLHSQHQAYPFCSAKEPEGHQHCQRI